MELLDTVKDMTSKDYKKRFIAEYNQVKIRYCKLNTLINNYKDKKLDFTPKCPVDLLEHQQTAMGQYLFCLELRAQEENIKLGETA